MRGFVALRGAAAAQLALGRPRDAVIRVMRALEVLRTLPGGLGSAQLTGLRDNSGQDVDEVELGARAAASIGDAESLWVLLEHGRAALVLASLDRTDAERLRVATMTPELRAREATLREDEAAARHLLGEAQATGELAAIGRWRSELDKAQAAVAEVVARIHAESRPASSILYPEPASLDQVRAVLRAGESLVSFTTAGGESLALVITATSARIAKLGQTDSLAAACAAFDASRPGRASPESLKALRSRVVDSLHLDAGTVRLIVVPDGPLTSVPFALLAPELAVTYVPSGTVYVRQTAQRDIRGQSVLAFGDPDAGATSEPLPSAREAARAVGDRVLLGAEASEAGFRAVLAESASEKPPHRWRGIHFACHGVVDESNPWMSALELSAGQGHDGRLTALDIAEMRIDADLCALSACDSARGRVLRGDGVVGLSRAFLAAGAPRLLVSLWRVDDAATCALMKRFHELWKRGDVPAAEALRQAQASVREQGQWADPYYWASWQLWGLPD
jgi:CHAT domain-containing protein